MKFSQLGLAEPILRATTELGYETATPIQSQAIPVVLSGSDLIGCAQTGTGKTAAFTLPLLHRLLEQQHKSAPNPARSNERPSSPASPRAARPIRVLVLAPTRELAAQIEASFERYGRHTSTRQAVVFGGVSQLPQVKAIRQGVDVLVATPGRLLDLLGQGLVKLSTVQYLVLDEADQMLDMGFLPALKRIIALLPTARQTLMFSATMPEAIRRLAQQWLTNPASIQVAPVATPAERISQSVHLVDRQQKVDLLLWLLRGTPRRRTLVFSRTKHGADKIVKRLVRDGLPAVAIHGNKSQGARERALAAFKGPRPPVLVATDIAARGLDIREVSHVVNFDIPELPETYVHRIGRTARAGAEGVAVSFCSADERDSLRQIERLTRRTLPIAEPIEGFQITESKPVGETKRPYGMRPQSTSRRRTSRRERPSRHKVVS